MTRRTVRVAVVAFALLALVVGSVWAATINGTARNDTLRGGARADKIYGKGGNDKLFGAGGNDVLVGGPGNDLLVGGVGADKLSCGPGRDTATRDVRDKVARDCELVRGPKQLPPPPPTAPSPPLANAVKITLTGAPSQFAVGGGSVWVGAHRHRLLFRIDPQTNAVRARIELPGRSCGIAVTAAAVWVGHCVFEDRGLSRIDPETNQVVSTIAGVNAGDVTAAAGSIWITEATVDEVWRLDPQTSQFVAKIPVGARPVSSGFGFGSVWVASFSSATVSRIDPDTNQVVSTIRVGTPGRTRGDTTLAVGEGAVWVTNSADNKLYRIDPATNAATTIDVGAGLQGRWLGMSVAVGLGSVWIETSEDVVSRLDPRTNRVVQRMTLGHGTGGAGLPYGGGGLAVGFDSLWATDPEADLLLRIRP